MSIYDDSARDAADLAKLVNEDTDVTTRYGTNPKVSAPKAIRLIEVSGTATVNQIQTDAANAIATLNTSRGFRDVGDFATGFTYELANDVAVDGGGNYWAYADINALPVTVPAGTTPTEGEYSQRTWNEASAVVTTAGINAQQFIDSFELKIFQSPTDNLTKISTFAGGVGFVYEVRKTSDNSLATIYSDKDGFLYNDAFNFRFERDGLLLDAQQLKLDLFWWHCDGMCIDNLSARSIKLNLPASSSNSPDTSNEPLEQISLPFNIALKRLAVSEFVLNHTSANVVVNNVEISAKAQGADIKIKNVNIPSVLIALKEQPGENTASSTKHWRDAGSLHAVSARCASGWPPRG